MELSGSIFIYCHSMQFEIVILGCGAATPTVRHLPTAQAINWNGRWMLIDAGEGVQLSLRKEQIPFQKIDRIFISHMHGDHIFGLPGLIGSMALLGRTKELKLYGPEKLEAYVHHTLKISETHLKFPLTYHRNDSEKFQSIHEEHGTEITAFPVKHRIEAFGYKFNYEAPQWNIRRSMIEEKGLLRHEIIELKKGIDVLRQDGTMLSASNTCHPKPAPICYVYSGDTRPCDNILIAAKHASLLYHEATFLDDKKAIAKKTGHSTARQAGQIAQEANVNELLIGHFSSRYRNEQLLVTEAKEVFDNVHLAREGLRWRLGMQ